MVGVGSVVKISVSQSSIDDESRRQMTRLAHINAEEMCGVNESKGRIGVVDEVEK